MAIDPASRAVVPDVTEPPAPRPRIVFSAGTARKRRGVWHHIPSPLRRAVVPILAVLLWQLGGAAGWWSTDVLPSPTSVAEQFWKLLVDGQLVENLIVSLRRVAIGAAFGIGTGLLLGVAVGLWRPVEEVLDSTLQMIRTIPFLVTLPLFVLWFGVDELPKILIIAIGTALPMYLNTMSGVRSVDPRLVEMAERFGLGRLSLIGTVILPGAMPSVLTGLRYSLGISWLALIVAEQINAQEGLGFLISNAQALFQTKIIMVVVVVYATLGLLTDLVVRLIESRVLAWRSGTRQAVTR
jgi:sulfonate transport system permease protein